VVAGTVIYSTNPVMVASTTLSGPAFAFWRLVAGTALFGIVVAARRPFERRRPSSRAWKWQAAAGLLFGVQLVFYASALRVTTVADVSLINRLSPIIVAVAAAPLFGERPGRTFRLGSALGILGAAIVVVGSAGGPEGSLGGSLMALVNVVAFSGWFLVSKASRQDLDVPRLLLGTFAVGLVVVGAYTAVTGEVLSAITGRDVLLVIGVAVLSGGIGHLLTTWPLRWVPANIPPLVALSSPVLSGLQAWFFLDQGVTWATVTGGAVTLAGIGIAMLGRSGRQMTRQARLDAAADTT
jgi:drug/metabolite transporter (DMT)-like permease